MGRMQPAARLMILGGSTLAVILAIIVVAWAPRNAVPMMVTLVSATGLAGFCAWAVVSLDRGRH